MRQTDSRFAFGPTELKPSTIHRRPMSLEICPHQELHKQAIWNLFQFYCYDTSVYDGYDVEESGFYSMSAEYFSQYWSTPTWRAHLLCWNGAIAGFALIEDSDSVSGALEVADLFVMRRFRRHGIAAKVALHFMEQRDVPWTIVVFDDADDAKSFWGAMFKVHALTPSRTLPDPDGRAATVHVLDANAAA